MASAHDLARALTRGRLEFLAHLDDNIWEVVGGGPQGWRHRLGSVALNPQPGRDVLLGAALGAAGLAARYPEGEMRDLFDGAGQRLMDAALG